MTKGKLEKEEGEVDDDNEGDEKHVFTMVLNAQKSIFKHF